MTGWNSCVVDTQLKDHNLKVIARPNNDTLYISCALDLRKDAVILDIPAFSSKYVSLMTFSYDHYVNVPLTTRKGDFGKPERVMFYTARTENYDGEVSDGVSRTFEISGDFAGAVFRVMPHASDPNKFKTIVGEMQSVKLSTLSEYQGGQAKPADDVTFPPFGQTDADVFGINLLEVMQFVFNHMTFDPDDEIDQGVLDAYKPLGVEPAKTYNPSSVAQIDGERFREVAQQVQKENFAILTSGDFTKWAPRILRPKGETDLDALVLVSVVGPIGLPLEEATYPAVTTANGTPMNAQNDYVIRMTKDQLPPAKAFWSLTLYDLQNGFFIPNDRKKYSVGENAGMKLNVDGGIDIYVAAERPEGVPEENWLPINRKEENMDMIMRIYVPDLETFRVWSAPRAELLSD
ncbi:MAG: DUF1214 domain-containing protein [Betaproteobacteria bacterium]|nr:MAG: DUF1214 domain-containing protein [Betaproteobacteria bacterium]